MSSISLPDTGVPVVSADGSVIGKVGEVRSSRIQVCSGGRELWLRNEAIDSVDAEGLHLTCDAGHLYRHIATPPAPAHTR